MNMMTPSNKIGHITQVLGAVVDVQFDGHLPEIMNALATENRGNRLIDPLPGDFRCPFTAGMTELDADLSGAVRMHEFDQPPPLCRLFLIPKTKAAGRDAGIRRDAGHFRKDEASTTEGA